MSISCPPGSLTDPDGAMQATCARPSLSASPSAFDINNETEFTFRIENCGTKDLYLTRPEGCGQEEVPTWIELHHGDRTWYVVGMGPASDTLDIPVCGATKSTTIIMAGTTYETRGRWDGTYADRSECPSCLRLKSTPMAPGIYTARAYAIFDNYEAVDATTDIELGAAYVPLVDATPAIEFLFNSTHHVNETVEVKIRNVGERNYTYNQHFAACNLSYHRADGSQFIIPPGTHCDLVSMATLAPGATATLFTWSLDECVHDQWGCSKAEPLAPGTYRIRGVFDAVSPQGRPEHEHSARAGATLVIE